jgi:hypothetical protein
MLTVEALHADSGDSDAAVASGLLGAKYVGISRGLGNLSGAGGQLQFTQSALVLEPGQQLFSSILASRRTKQEAIAPPQHAAPSAGLLALPGIALPATAAAGTATMAARRELWTTAILVAS